MSSFLRHITIFVVLSLPIAAGAQHAQTAPALLQVFSSDVPSNPEVSKWRPGVVVHLRKWFVHLGQHGELIGGPDYNIGADILYCIPTERGIELHHSGPTWKGIFAHVDHKGVIHVSEDTQKSDVRQLPHVEYGPWSARSADGSLRPLAKDEIIFPKENGGTVRAAKRPFRATGWVIPLVGGELYFPLHRVQPPPKTLWIVPGKKTIKIIERGPNRNDSWASIGSDLVVSSDRDPHWNEARWIYVDEQQRPVVPPPGTIVVPGAHDANLTTVMSDGRLFVPGTAIP